MARLKVVVLSACMLLFGTINTLTTKFQDLAVVDHTPDGKPLAFNHPAVQSAFMFFGEMLCLLPFFFMEWRYASAKSRVRRRAELERLGPAFRLRRVLIFAIPAACDAVATTLLNVGLFYTYASTYQMLRGTLVLFAGFFTITILRRALYVHHWLGMVLITGGAALVGAASVLSPGRQADGVPSSHSGAGPAGAPSLAGVVGGDGMRLALGARRLASLMLGGEPGVEAAAAPLFGDLCVVVAQAFTALQFILEEKFVAQYRVPTLLAVGLEGMWGTAICTIALPVLALVRTGPYHRPVDSAVEAFKEIAANGPLAVSMLVTVLSIGSFNFFGISVTKALSGAARATIDATRTLFVMLASMWLGWEHFLPLQVVGFAVLFAGTSLYNELIRICLPRTAELEAVEEADETCSECSGYESGEDSEIGRRGGSGKTGDTEAGDLSEPLLASAAVIAASGGASGTKAGGALSSADVLARSAAGHSQPQAATVGRSALRRTTLDSVDSTEYTMARSMRLGHSTLMPHALDADTDDAATESEGPTGYSPGMSFGSGHTGGILSQPNIPEGEEEGELVGAMSGLDVYDGVSGGDDGAQGGTRHRGGGPRVSIAIGPHGMLSGGVGRGATGRR
ncbi:hypothetical protein VaNZ11_011682 [Volvox africanus]|uniref:EamA domain-containing protein n=1 Tax=Volvox africanus TaxID=51714 RepID=A0ABQ5SC25_9CHLO|nr:hypothetical protein VaNZ11_011682 [Volvox africanus]